MILPAKKKLTLLTEIYSDNSVLKECCKSISHSNNNEPIWSNDDENSSLNGPFYYSIKNVPGYFNISYLNTDKNCIKKFPSVKGYSICLDDYSDVDTYIKDKLYSKGKPLKRALKRLETCFDIKYVMFHGKIERDTYNLLFHSLGEMIVKRFKQRNEKSHNIDHLNTLFETCYDMIHEKKVSFFVIYHKEKPIEISLNYNYGNILFSYISSYDIDYHKFSLGQVEIYKQLEWCIENKFRFFEMGWGDLEYKQRWSNNIYTFEHHLVFPKKSIPAYLSALVEGNKTRLIAYLISKNVNVYFKKAKNIFLANESSEDDGPKIGIGEVQKGKMEDSNYVPIDLPFNTSYLINESIYNFLYSTQEKYEKVRLYKKNNKEYLIQGENHFQNVVIETLSE